jgi:hypothetical protein
MRTAQEASRVTPISIEVEAGGSVRPVAAVTSSGESSEPLAQRIQQAEALVAAIQSEQPDLFFEPMLRFPLAALQRRTGRQEEAKKFWRSQMSGRIDPAYRSWASSELALLVPDSLPARPSWSCPRLKQSPRLDGHLDDAAWSSIEATSLKSAFTNSSESPKTQVRLAYDSAFLYLAIRAEKVSAMTYTQLDSIRQRDQVSDGDRFEIYLDVDRDAVTHWCLQVDHRGWAGERLNDDASWDPQWYVASSDDASSWTVEAAIPLEALCRNKVVSGACWCVGVQRIMPGYDWETWLQPAPVETCPAEFGLLRFE